MAKASTFDTAANPQRGEYDVEIGDRTWRLRVSTNAMVWLEEESGIRATDMQQIFLDGTQTLSNVRSLLYALSRENQPDVTVDEVGDLMDEMARMSPEKVEEVLAAAMAVGNPEPSESDPPRRGFRKAKKAKKAKRAPRGGTGAGRSASRSGTASRRTVSGG